MHRNLGWGINSQPHLVAADIDDRDDNVVANNDAFVSLSGQDEHRGLLPSYFSRLGRSAVSNRRTVQGYVVKSAILPAQKSTRSSAVASAARPARKPRAYPRWLSPDVRGGAPG